MSQAVISCLVCAKFKSWQSPISDEIQVFTTCVSERYDLPMIEPWVEGWYLISVTVFLLWQNYSKQKKKQKYRGMFKTQKSGNKTSSREIGLNIRTLASPRVGQDQVSGGVSVLCWHAAPAANVLNDNKIHLVRKSISAIWKKNIFVFPTLFFFFEIQRLFYEFQTLFFETQTFILQIQGYFFEFQILFFEFQILFFGFQILFFEFQIFILLILNFNIWNSMFNLWIST